MVNKKAVENVKRRVKDVTKEAKRASVKVVDQSRKVAKDALAVANTPVGGKPAVVWAAGAFALGVVAVVAVKVLFCRK